MSKTRGKPAQAQPKSRNQPSPPYPARLDLAIWLGLVVSVFAVYAQVGHFDFITYDDELYVYENVHVQTGLTLENVKWAFTAVVSNNWMPVTLLSHLLDGQLFGMQGGMHHLVNVVFHALSSVLLFIVLRRATGARWPSAFVAFVFALHPLHVGSVAWVAERKDVLSTFFWFLALYAYVRYAERPSVKAYVWVAGLFCLGLMSKPMLVTFPFTLLLFDIWPLRRLEKERLKMLWEKVPLIVLSAGASAVTYFVQSSTGAVQAIPLGTRVGNALISYITYIGQTLWPAGLAVFYPYPLTIAASQAAFAAIVILGVSVGMIFAWRMRPYLGVGWFWYLGTLVPVIGLVQVGMQPHADRYTYIPMIGLSVMLAWGAAEMVAKWPAVRSAMVAAAAVGCTACMALAWNEAAYWRNSETLYQRAIDVTHDNWVAEYNLGHYLMSVGRGADAIPHFEAVLRIKPGYTEANNNLGVCLMNVGRNAEAVAHFEAALRATPNSADTHSNLGLVLSKMPGRDPDAMVQYEAALRLNPASEEAHNNLGLLLVKQGRTAEAIPHFEAAARANPNYRNEHNLGAILLTVPGRQSEALAHLEAALRIQPDPEVARVVERLRAGKK